MTYISRRTRITLFRRSDGCDPEISLQASRKRSDGRLKRHASCEDPRAWVNNNCIKYEHLLDLMSDGEATGSTYRLYGRFVPVPVLLELMQNKDAETGQADSSKKMNYRSGQETENSLALRNEQYEKNLLQKSFIECTSLLNRAVCKLERIDSIVTQATEESENSRNEEIQEAFCKSKLQCSCSKSSQNNSSENFSSSKSCMRKTRESTKCTELLRKISGLREKLKKIQECRQEVNEQIRSSQRRTEKHTSSLQVTELYSCREQAHIKKLQKKLERLITERGRLLSQMCHALNCLNNLKKSSRSSMSFRKRNSRSSGCEEDFPDEDVEESSSSNCQCSDGSESSESDKLCSESSSEEGMNDNYCKESIGKRGQMERVSFSDTPRDHSSHAHRSEHFESFSNRGRDSSLKHSKNRDGQISAQQQTGEYKKQNVSTRKQNSRFNSASTPGFTRANFSTNQKNALNSVDENREEKNRSSSKKKMKLKFECPEGTCKRGFKDSLSDFKSSLSPEQQAIILDALENIKKSRSSISAVEERTNRGSRTLSSRRTSDSNSRQRPSTTPTTRAERKGKSLDRARNTGCIHQRRIKSETTMKDIEKSLRNYEVRLSGLDGLDYKIEELKQKLMNENRLRQQIAKQKAEEKKQRAVDREKSNREISKLCSENWELKKQVQQLTANFETQCRKIQSLKCTARKAKELECETEELKKELSEYRDGFEDQRKCIARWESLVAVQRTEIENLMNHIRNLTTVEEGTPYGSCPEKKNVQRSRSYSPEMVKTRGMSRPKRQAMAYRSSDEDEAPCCCDDSQGQEVRRGQERNYCPPQPNRRTAWCRN